MISIEKNLLKLLIEATNDRVLICEQIPAQNSYLFIVEKINLLQHWKEIYPEFKALTIGEESHVSINNQGFNKLLYYFHFMAKFFSYNGNESEDRPYIISVEDFIARYTKFKKGIFPKQEEKLFWLAFPK